MKTISLHDGTTIPVIGLGTWSIGGGSSPDSSQDGKGLQALRWSFETGYTHIDTAEGYASGHTEELVGQALKDFDRSRFFITTKVSPSNLQYDSVLRALDGSLKRLGVEYIDLYLIHWPSRSIPLSDTFRALNQVVREGRVRYLGVSNFNLEQLKQSQELSETPIATNQVPYSLFVREYVQNGVLEHCQQNQIALTAYSPVKQRRLRTNDIIKKIAAAHGATPLQIALAWLVQQPWVITIPMSKDQEHLRQNWQAGEINLTDEEMVALNGLAG